MSPEYSTEGEGPDAAGAELAQDEAGLEEDVVGVVCCFSRGDADNGGDSGSADDTLEGGAKLVAFAAVEEGVEFPLKLVVFLPFTPADPSFPGGVSTDSGMATVGPCGEGNASEFPLFVVVAGFDVMLKGDSFRLISRFGG